MNTATAMENTARAPKRSAVQPLAGMNTASDSRYEVIASFSVSGLVPISAAIAGSEVAITVEFDVLHEQGGGHDERDQAFFVHWDLRRRERVGGTGLYHSAARAGHCGTAETIKKMLDKQFQ